MDDQEDKPIVTLEQVFKWLHGIFAIIGLAATSAGIGLYHSGFFHWLLK